MASLKLSASMDNFDAFMDFLKSQIENEIIEKKTLNDILIAGEEAIVNVLRYAYPDKNGELELIVEHQENPKGVSIELIDSGIAFNPLERLEPDINAPVEDRPIGGLGIFMIKKMMDELNYSRENGQNKFRLIKHY
jgi:anti-sigma regulatory factor (Ser/Thr protein kinase)